MKYNVKLNLVTDKIVLCVIHNTRNTKTRNTERDQSHTRSGDQVNRSFGIFKLIPASTFGKSKLVSTLQSQKNFWQVTNVCNLKRLRRLGVATITHTLKHTIKISITLKVNAQ